MKRLFVLFLSLFLLLVACSEGDTEVKSNASEEDEVTEEEILTAKEELEEINKEINDRRNTSGTLKNTIAEREQELEQLEEEMADIIELDNNREELEEEVKTLAIKVGELKAEIREKEEELEALTAGVKAREEEPIELGAGQYLVGMDLPPDRYEVFPVGRGSNFFVYGSSGSSKVNVILSNREGHGVPSYVFVASDGDYIETNTPVKFVPVE